MRLYGGTIANTNERCKMVATGYWIGANGRRITSYKRFDKEDNKQYSKDRYCRFWVESED